MNIVIIGIADSIFIQSYIQQVLLNNVYEIYLITYTNQQFQDFYKENNITVYEYGGSDSYGIKTFQKRKQFADSILKEIDNIDIVHVHYLDRTMIRICKKIWRRGRKKIITFWGSDLLRTRQVRLRFYKETLKQAYNINVMTREMLDVFERIYGRKLASRVLILDYGDNMYDVISEVKAHMSQEECKKYWGIKQDKVVIAVGYNSKKEQQHDRIIKELVKVPRQLRSRITVVLHFGYGDYKESYLKDLVVQLKNAEIDYLVINRFLDKEEIAILRLCTDIFLYGQTTDALAASALEYVYAEAVFVKPSWLDYSLLEQNGIFYVEYKKFSEVRDIVTELLGKNLQAYKERSKDNVMKLWKINSWEILKPAWLKLYQ